MDIKQMSPVEMIQILPKDMRTEAMAFIKLGEERKCKAQTRYAASNKYWRCVFSLRQPPRVLFALECTEEWWRIKAVLGNMKEYVGMLDHCAADIVDTIKTAYDCHRCNTSCKGAIPFTYEDTEYCKCIGCSYYFRDISPRGLENLKMLITAEADVLRR